MYNPNNLNPLTQFVNKTSSAEKPLGKAEAAFQEWYLKNPDLREKRAKKRNLSDMDEFSDIFDGATLESDKRFIKEERRKEGQMYKTERGEIFEVITEKLVDEAGWFGDNCYITPTLEFDDRKAHTDFILEWEGENGEITHLAVDCTTSEDTSRIERKVGRIVHEIEKEELTFIKYFESSQFDKKWPLKNVPRVVLALETDKLEELCALALRANNKERGSNQLFGNYYLQLFFLKEMLSQLEYQLEYAKEKAAKNPNNKNMRVVEEKISSVLIIIKSLIDKKENSLDASAVKRANDEIRESRYFSSLVPASL